MAEQRKTFRCCLLTPRQPVLEVEATAAVFPGPDGLVGVLPQRAALTAALGKGTVMVRSAGGESYYDIRGGVAHMGYDELTILTEECKPSPARRLLWSGEPPAGPGGG